MSNWLNGGVGESCTHVCSVAGKVCSSGNWGQMSEQAFDTISCYSFEENLNDPTPMWIMSANGERVCHLNVDDPDARCGETHASAHRLCNCVTPTCGEDKTCPNGYNPRNHYSECSSDNCSSYDDLMLCCSINQICGSLGSNACKNTYPGHINNPETYNEPCIGEYCDISVDISGDISGDKDKCCISGCDEDEFLEDNFSEGKICRKCLSVPYSSGNENIVCTSRYDSRFIDINSNDNCRDGKMPYRGRITDTCINSDKICAYKNICTRPGYVQKKDGTSECVDTCNFFSDKDKCCGIDTGYEICMSGLENNECIEGVRCQSGYIRRYINNVEGCFPDTSMNFDVNSDGEIGCRFGFEMTETGQTKQCNVDTDNNFVCSDATLEKCIGGDAVCKGGYYYNSTDKSCIPGSSIFGGYLSCREGEVNDIYGNCVLEEIRNGIPTNLLFDSKNKLTCKKGYAINRVAIECTLDSYNGNQWECQRNNETYNDGERCCDPIIINDKPICSSRPVCLGNNYEFNGDCINSNSEKTDCSGYWSPCEEKCEDSRYIITRERSGRGEVCRGDDGEQLFNGDKKSCRASGECLLYEQNNILCGANLSNKIIEDEENWMWEWNNINSRDTCDRIYKGGLENCNRKEIGNGSTRKYCDKYENKCMGNTNPREDFNCYSVNKIPKEGIYNLDKKGDSIDSCCEDFNVVESFKRTNYTYDEKDKKLRELLNIKRTIDEMSINQLLRR